MARHSLLISAIALGSVLTFPMIAKAENPADVFFNGTITQSCEFENVVDGTLGLVTSDTLSSVAVGTPGSADLACNTLLASVTMDAPVVETAPNDYDDTAAVKTATLVGGSINLTLNAGETQVSVPSAAVTLAPLPLVVNMTATTPGEALPAGDYTYYVRLSATPL
ncbi:MAG: hypothetical protein F6J97_16130 [Leptolyngbya sp. SIO4C1]|nr:hypothetical protein [Leptolyngbya sp. SIO4C1]